MLAGFFFVCEHPRLRLGIRMRRCVRLPAASSRAPKGRLGAALLRAGGRLWLPASSASSCVLAGLSAGFLAPSVSALGLPPCLGRFFPISLYGFVAGYSPLLLRWAFAIARPPQAPQAPYRSPGRAVAAKAAVLFILLETATIIS